MSSRANFEVRLVRCPKCRHVLRELVEVPIYSCGGCGAILEAKKPGKDLQGVGPQAHEADPNHKNKVQNTSENPITDGSCIDKSYKGVDSATGDRIESLGEINKSSQLYDSDTITCHEIKGSSADARACNEEEDGTVPLNQYGTADHNPYQDEDRDSENGASNEVLPSSELNQKESNSLLPQVHNHASESLLLSLETETQSRHSSSEYNFYGEEEVAENDLGNATENPSAIIETESPPSSEDNCDGGKKEFENELQNTYEECSPDNKYLENVHAEGKSGADGRREWIGSVNPITCHEIAYLSLRCIAPAEADKCEVSFSQSGIEAHYESVYDNEKSGDVSTSNKVLARNEEEDDMMPLNQYGAADNPYKDEAKDSENGASNEILSSSELNQKERNSLVPQVHNHERETLLSSLETETQSRHSSSEYNCDGEKEVAEYDLGNATENPSAVIETESPDSSEDNCDGGKKEFENELQNTSEECSPDNKDLENVHAEGKSGADGRTELIGSVSPITCHEISDLSLRGIAPAEANKCEVSFNQSGAEAHYKSVYDNEKSRDVSISNKVLARNEEEDGTVPLNQYGTADHNPYQDEAKDSENGASNEIMSSSELNQKESNSLVPQVHNHDSDSILSSLETETQSRHSSSEYNCDGDKEVAENDLGNATENPSSVIETESPRSSEDNSDGGKKEFENELQNTSEKFSPDKDLENVHVEGKSGADGRREWIGRVNPITCHEISDLSLRGIAPAEADKREVSFNQSGTEVHYNVYDNEKSGDVSISNKVLSSPKLNQLENDSSVPGYHMYGSSESLLSSPKKVTGSGCSSPNNDDDGKNKHPSLVEELDENRESFLILTSAETFPDTVTKDQIFTTDSFSNEGISLDNLLSSHREMQQVEGGMVPSFQLINSDDSLENMPHFYAKGDLGVTLRSSTARNYYAYDVSAFGNESDDQVPNRRFQQLKGSLKDVGPNSTKVFPERSEYVMNHVTSNESKLQRQLMNSGSSLRGKKHSTTKVSRWHQDELLERSRYRSPVRNRMRNETDDYHSRLLFSKYRFQADQGSSSSSNYGQKDFSALPDNPHELHRLELLRMVYELQDQLRKTQLSEGRPRGRILTIPSRGKEHHFADNRKDYSDLAYHNYHEKYRRDITWLKNRELSQMVLPEDPIQYMHRVDCLCLRCCSHEQYHSAQKPPHAICYSEEQSMTYARQTSRPYHSASSIAHKYATSEFSLWSQDMKPDDQWYNKHKEARVHHIAKQHFQPVAGGAPIIACYHCSEMLQIPAESLLFKRRCHQLKCGACSKVLKFSLENKIHVIRDDLISRTPLPSVIAENTRVMKKSNLALAHRGSDRPLAEPAASSYDSQSFSRSYSTGDNFSVIPGNFSSASSFKTPKEGTKSESTRASIYKNKSSVESFKSAVSSFNMLDSEHSSSESEVESPLPGTSLHKLMGYSSIRRLVFQ